MWGFLKNILRSVIRDDLRDELVQEIANELYAGGALDPAFVADVVAAFKALPPPPAS